MPEARLEQTKYGLAQAEEGWFVLNARDGAWMTNEPVATVGCDRD